MTKSERGQSHANAVALYRDTKLLYGHAEPISEETFAAAATEHYERRHKI